jgi:hypothetical protein
VDGAPGVLVHRKIGWQKIGARVFVRKRDLRKREGAGAS